MKIHENYPNYLDFKRNEFKTLKYIREKGFLYNLSEELAYKIDIYHDKYNVDLTNATIDILLDFPMLVEKHIHKVILGVNLRGEGDINSYLLALCGKDDDENELIRKFHFDYALPDSQSPSNIPIFHLQYGGRTSDKIKESLNLNDSKIEKWLSIPRLNYAPMNLALLLDTIFCEFINNSIEVVQIHENPDWRKLVYENEKFLYSHYFNNISEHINSHHYTHKHLLRDLYYGK